MKHNMQVFDMH